MFSASERNMKENMGRMRSRKCACLEDGGALPPLPPHHASEEEEASFLLQANLSTRVCFFSSSGTLLQRQCSSFPVCQHQDLSVGSFSEA